MSALLFDGVLAALVLAGAGFTLVGSIGLVRMRDVFQRMHAPTKASTLGVGCLLAASALAGLLDERGLSFNELLIALFLFVTAPVSAYLVARVSLHHGLGARTGLEEGAREAEDGRPSA